MDVYVVARVPDGRDPGDLFKHLVDKYYDFFVTKDVAAISKWKEGNPDIFARNEIAQDEPQEIVPLQMEEAFVNQVNGGAADAVMQENFEDAGGDPQNGAPDDSAMGELVAAEQPLYNPEIKMENVLDVYVDPFEEVNPGMGLLHRALSQMNQIEADFSPDGSLNGEEEEEERSHILEMEKADDKNQAKQIEQIEKGQKKQEAKKDTAKDPNRTWCEDCQRCVVRSYFEAHRERMHQKLEKKINQKEAVAKKLEKVQKKKEKEGSEKHKKYGKSCGDCGKAFSNCKAYSKHTLAFCERPHFFCEPCNKSFPMASNDRHRH